MWAFDSGTIPLCCQWFWLEWVDGPVPECLLEDRRSRLPARSQTAPAARARTADRSADWSVGCDFAHWQVWTLVLLNEARWCQMG